jgi:Fe-S-cluster containining protein
MEQHPLDKTKKIIAKKNSFQFKCHPGVSCFLACCSNVDLLLYPYDILRLKITLGLRSADFLNQYVRVCEGSHPYFPGLKLRLLETYGNPCPFLGKKGCGVYADRPSACRTYPLERAVERKGNSTLLSSVYFLTQHPWCHGHNEINSYTLDKWEREQDLHEWNLQNEHWAEIDAFFASNPWSGEGKAGPMQQLAFMVCYNIDAFRQYTRTHCLLDGYVLTKLERRKIETDDSLLLVFGYKWLETILGGRNRLIAK